MLTKYNLIVITGATAGGKTSVAANLALKIDGEIISADSRQVYRGMDIGTGKDLDDYNINGVQIPYHLINIVEAGTKYNVFEYRKDFFKVYSEITYRNKIPILCGGTGLYIDSVIKDYQLLKVPVNDKLREELKNLSIEELENILITYKKLHNRSDLDTTKRAIRAIEIADFNSRNEIINDKKPKIGPIIFGILYNREERRNRITERLKYRLENGMIEEAKKLIDSGITYEDLEYYGLEYKFLSWYLSGKINYDELFLQLNSAIHQFSKRQMTWFRKMEKEGTKINWIDGNLSMEEKMDVMIDYLK
ncbi:MAG TPA: tRNA (adenosine(37)-N6)-dimethylallyltransferase MiaA [Bacteroidales bacterium]|nr:tRNA (adenosine(37)-N6)-dimethylallyltransferase MiaA [Bacteroidales bacterium]